MVSFGGKYFCGAPSRPTGLAPQIRCEFSSLFSDFDCCIRALWQGRALKHKEMLLREKVQVLHKNEANGLEGRVNAMIEDGGSLLVGTTSGLYALRLSAPTPLMELGERNVVALSGGERTRLLLAVLANQPAGLLALDEPTNHLDLPSLEVLEQALLGFPGGVLLVSHDRRLVRNVATEVFKLKDGGLSRAG